MISCFRNTFLRFKYQIKYFQEHFTNTIALIHVLAEFLLYSASEFKYDRLGFRVSICIKGKFLYHAPILFPIST